MYILIHSGRHWHPTGELGVQFHQQSLFLFNFNLTCINTGSLIAP